MVPTKRTMKTIDLIFLLISLWSLYRHHVPLEDHNEKNIMVLKRRELTRYYWLLLDDVTSQKF